MATYSKVLFSESINGKSIIVDQAGATGTAIHTAVAGTSDIDEVWLYAVNSSASTVKLTVEWGESNDPEGNIEISIPTESGLYNVIPGLIIQNSLVIRAFADTADVIGIYGFVNRITA